MLYDNPTPVLEDRTFAEAPRNFRGAPFWAFNCKLDKAEMARQIEVFREMGFGGFYMHVRTGLETPYLSDEYMDYIRFCVEQARKVGLRAYLYDEDRWPSGSAGGLVTKERRFRARFIRFSSRETPGVPAAATGTIADAQAAGGAGEQSLLLARYDVELTPDGYLASYQKLEPGEEPAHTVWYAYRELHVALGWYNNQAYVNTLDKQAIDRFIELTHERYAAVIGADFGGVVPTIFTDEPQFSHKSTLHYADDRDHDAILPFSDDLPETFSAAYGEDLLAGLPELFWELPDGAVSRLRYHYHDHVCQRFTESFADNCGRWCEEHGIAQTGHMMMEDTLESQTSALGEAMRSYRSFELPGIDMLSGEINLQTAKQAQSAAHQYGREGILSEIYGVTGWDFDFRGHKFHGDWQAALGVTHRVPHLAWMSMQGESKRDYPASISYQSPWYKEYAYVEDHFARLNTALTRGRPVVRIGVIHPVESYWLHFGPKEQTALARGRLEDHFLSLTRWLLFGGLDFDFISESLLPDLCKKPGSPLTVGEMQYDVILVPGCETLRSTTLERLEAFRSAGGKLVFLGEAPKFADALPSARGKALYESAVSIPFEQTCLLEALAGARTVELRGGDGALTGNLIYQMRQDGARRWLFVAHAIEPYNKDLTPCQQVRIRVKGIWYPTKYDTVTGKIAPIAANHSQGDTFVEVGLYDYDSLLLALDPTPVRRSAEEAPAFGHQVPLSVPQTVAYTCDEPNALLLDRAQYAAGDAPYSEDAVELLRADNLCRAALGMPPRTGYDAQPWVEPDDPVPHRVRLRFTIESEAAFDGLHLALEQARATDIYWNGQAVASAPDGYYVDRSIETVPLPPAKAGENILELVCPLTRRIGLEWCYLLGGFGVAGAGQSYRLVPPASRLAFDSILPQGLPFYSGALSYHLELQTDRDGTLRLHLPHYRGAVIRATLDGTQSQMLAYPPYTLDFAGVAPGAHTLALKLYIPRTNGFASLHQADEKLRWLGPDAWRTTGDAWTESYRLSPEGILSPPTLTLLCD